MADQNIVGKQDLAPEKDLEIVFDIHCSNSVVFLFRTSKMEYIIETEGFFFLPYFLTNTYVVKCQEAWRKSKG